MAHQRGPHDIQGYIDTRTSTAPLAPLQFPLDRPKYYTVIKFYSYTFSSGTGGGRNFTDQGAIVLPLPVNLVDLHRVRWDEKPIFPWASFLEGTRVLGAVTGAVRNVGSALTGLAPNEFQTVIFDRPEFKRHELTFKLAPKDFRESEIIRDILVKLNNAAAPGLQTGDALFQFPDVIQVIFRPNDGFLYKFKPAVIDAIAIDYAGGDQKKAFYRDQSVRRGDNPPESVNFTLQINETEFWLKGDFTPGHSPLSGGL